MMVEKIIDDFFNEYKEKFNDIEEKNEIFINVFFISLINNNSLESGLNYYLKKMEETLNYLEIFLLIEIRPELSIFCSISELDLFKILT